MPTSPTNNASQHGTLNSAYGTPICLNAVLCGTLMQVVLHALNIVQLALEHIAF